MIVLTEFGTEFLAARFRAETRAFQLEQRKQMRKAANVVKRDVVAKLRSGSPLRSGVGGGRFRTGHSRVGQYLGPLARHIGVKLFNTTADVGASIRPSMRVFYGRFHETGISKTVTRKNTHVAYFGGGFKLLKAGTTYQLNIPRRPFLEPVANVSGPKVAAIMGDAYGVFYRGGA